MESKHTKGIWQANIFMREASIYCGEQKEGIVKMKYNDFPYAEEKVIANAEHIVKCVNAHDELVNLLKEVLDAGKDSASGKYIQFFTFSELGKKIQAALKKVTDATPTEVG